MWTFYLLKLTLKRTYENLTSLLEEDSAMYFILSIKLQLNVLKGQIYFNYFISMFKQVKEGNEICYRTIKTNVDKLVLRK